MKFASFLKSSLHFNSFYCLLFINKTLRLNDLKARTAMNAKALVFVICVDAIIYLLLYNLHTVPLKVKTKEIIWHAKEIKVVIYRSTLSKFCFHIFPLKSGNRQK